MNWPVGRLAKEMGFSQISLSSRVMPMIKLVARGDTTMTDAYLNPHIQDYLTSFRSGFSDHLEKTGLLFMQSDGGLAPADDFTGSRAILSGPAGGVVGFAMTHLPGRYGPAGDRIRHGRHFHRRQPLRRRV